MIMEGDYMNFRKRNNRILMYIFLMIIMIFSACSNKKDKSETTTINPIKNNSENEDDQIDTEVTPSASAAPTDDAENPNENSNVIDETIKNENSETIQDNTDGNNETENSEAENSETENSETENSEAENSETVQEYEIENTSSIGEGSNDNETGILPSEKNTKDNTTDNSTSKEPSKGSVAQESTPTKSPIEEQNNQATTTKKIIAVDAGHQSKGNNEKEPIGPGSKITKPKVSSGTQGISSGVAEYELNLVIAQKVETELIRRGYEVFMIRDTHNVNLSNKKRAEMANESGADLFIHIHADSSTSSDANGTSTLYPSKDNPYVSDLSEDSYALSNSIVDAICEKTGSKNRGAIARDDMSGINWCSLPVSIIEMGFMSNKKEDKLMQTEDYQDKIVEGICDGIDKYYE